MSLTINTIPDKIDNSAAFNVTTSLVEDSSHVNLRVRAEVYHEGIVKAIVEKPKGLADFDFADILKSLTPGIKYARNIGAPTVKTGTIGANLITSWAQKSGTYTTLTTAANVINSAICTVVSTLETNTVAMTVGDLYLFYSPDFSNSGSALLTALESGGSQFEYFATNKGFLLMPTSTGNIKITLGDAGTQNFSGTFYLYKITTNRSTVGNPLAPYFVLFTEVFENSSGVTTTDGVAKTILNRYVPAKGDGTSFAEYVLHDSLSLFANKTLKNNICKFYSVSPFEYWLCFFTEYVELELYLYKDGGAADHTTHPDCYEGWGVVVLSVNDMMYLATSYSTLRMYNRPAASYLSDTITIYVDNTTIDERVVLEYDGLVGGKEYLAFEGLKDQQFTTVRNYFTGASKNKKPLSFFGICRQKLETLFKDVNNTEYLKSLLISEDVKRLEASYAAPTEVTVLTDTVSINKGRELFTNSIDIEYEY